jgi:hypothetical protein
MYKQLAAFAAALIVSPERYVPVFAIGNEIPVWGLSKTGEQCYSKLVRAHKLSILGAMRAASENIGGGSRAYNPLDREARRVAFDRYGADKLADLDHELAVQVLLTIAKG